MKNSALRWKYKIVGSLGQFDTAINQRSRMKFYFPTNTHIYVRTCAQLAHTLYAPRFSFLEARLRIDRLNSARKCSFYSIGIGRAFMDPWLFFSYRCPFSLCSENPKWVRSATFKIFVEKFGP